MLPNNFKELLLSSARFLVLAERYFKV